MAWLHQRCWLRYLVEATLQISKNQYVSLSSSFHKPLYLIVKKELFPFTNLVEFIATALPEQLHRRLVWISPRAGSNKFQDYSWRINQ